MKRRTAIICIVAMLCAMVLPANAVMPKTKEADIFDVLEILKDIVGMPNDAFEITGIEEPDIFDALAMLKGIVGMGEVVIVNVVEKCGDFSDEWEWLGKLYELIHVAETVEELKQSVMNYSDRVTGVRVFRDTLDFEVGIQIFEGALKMGMVVRVEYDENAWLLTGIECVYFPNFSKKLTKIPKKPLTNKPT